MRRTRRWAAGAETFCTLLVMALLVVGCDGTRQPRVVASYPQPEVEQQRVVVSDGRYELAVDDAARAADEVAHLADVHGGFVLDEAHWRDRDGRNASLIVLVPTAAVGAFYRDLRELGTALMRQVEVREDASTANTRVVVVLHEKASLANAWDPTRTLDHAFALFLHLFQLLIDGLIWIVVVGGPFVLMGIGLFVVLRRLRQGRGAG